MYSRIAFRSLFTFVPVVCTLAVPAWGGLVIDDFETGAFGPLVDTTTGGSPAQATQSGLPLTSVLLGVRQSSAGLFSGGGPVSAELDLSGPGDHGITFSIAAGSQGSADFFYLSLGGFDLTSGGQDSFLFTMSDDPGLGLVNIGFHQGFSFLNQNIVLNGSGEYLVPYADFAFLPTEITTLTIGINSAGSSGGYSATLSDFRTVPEPGTLALLFAGAGCLFRRRRR